MSRGATSSKTPKAMFPQCKLYCVLSKKTFKVPVVTFPPNVMGHRDWGTLVPMFRFFIGFAWRLLDIPLHGRLPIRSNVIISPTSNSSIFTAGEYSSTCKYLPPSRDPPPPIAAPAQSHMLTGLEIYKGPLTRRGALPSFLPLCICLPRALMRSII